MRVFRSVILAQAAWPVQPLQAKLMQRGSVMVLHALNVIPLVSGIADNIVMGQD